MNKIQLYTAEAYEKFRVTMYANRVIKILDVEFMVSQVGMDKPTFGGPTYYAILEHVVRP